MYGTIKTKTIALPAEVDMDVQDIRDIFKAKLATNDFAEDGNIEIVNASFVADESSIFGTPNQDWHQRELRWYLSQSLNVNEITPPVPAVWRRVANEEGEINSNYGWCIFSRQNGQQFERAINALEIDRNSRQAAMIYIRPSMHDDSKRGGMHDFMCTYSTQLIIRDDELHHLVFMRSNDAVYGYKGDYFWQDAVHDMALSRLKQKYKDLKKGKLYWNAGSLHIYPQHFELVK
jgi:thymidylate synthase